jgi:hypothetical protein
MPQFYLPFNKAVLTERAAEKHMSVGKKGKIIWQVDATEYMRFHRNSTEIRSVTLYTS